jgi:hypothetical protein
LYYCHRGPSSRRPDIWRTAAGTSLLVLIFCSQALAMPTDFGKQLQEADRLAWLTAWHAALPRCTEVEKAAIALA